MNKLSLQVIKNNKKEILIIKNRVFYKILFFINNITFLTYTFKAINILYYFILNLL